MTGKTDSTRRTFLKGSALFAAPLAGAVPATAMADDGTQGGLNHLEDRAAIRELNQSWLARINAGAEESAARLCTAAESALPDASMRAITPEPVEDTEAIDIAEGGKHATGRFPCTVEIENAIAPDCTLARMAHAQGTGTLRRSERRMLTMDYVKTGDGWRIAKAVFEPV